jgi:DNA repair photolyase
MIVESLTRKSLLYRSKVEYGGWTVNHVQGCAHGCRYPCYAMMLAKRVGRVSNYEEWVQPRIVENALELLDAELARHRGDVGNVHLSFTTDPFMYDRAKGAPVAAVCKLSQAIIERLNAAAIPVTTLTKGVYPAELIGAAGRLHPGNQYGISLVSLSHDFRERWEPGAASASARIAALRSLSLAGHDTWVSIEPYPTPNIDSSAPDVMSLLDSVSFVGKVVFGKWNYNALASGHDGEHGFYAHVAQQVVEWCDLHGKPLHIKKGTPLACEATRDVLRCSA